MIEGGHALNGYYSLMPNIYLVFLGFKIRNLVSELEIWTDIVSVNESNYLLIRDFDCMDYENLAHEKSMLTVISFLIGATRPPPKHSYPLGLNIKDLELEMYCFGLELFLYKL